MTGHIGGRQAAARVSVGDVPSLGDAVGEGEGESLGDGEGLGDTLRDGDAVKVDFTGGRGDGSCPRSVGRTFGGGAVGELFTWLGATLSILRGTGVAIGVADGAPIGGGEA